jgi:ABC-2 type transport system permease protein
LNSPSTVWEWRSLATTFLGILLIGGVYISLGCFASALTRSQLIAAAVSYAVGFTMFLLSLRGLVPIPPTGWDAKFFSYISMTEHMQDFASGTIDTRPVALYLSLTILFVFMTFKVVESRRWK